MKHKSSPVHDSELPYQAKRLKSCFDDAEESKIYSKFPPAIREKCLDEYNCMKELLLKSLDVLISEFLNDIKVMDRPTGTSVSSASGTLSLLNNSEDRMQDDSPTSSEQPHTIRGLHHLIDQNSGSSASGKPFDLSTEMQHFSVRFLQFIKLNYPFSLEEKAMIIRKLMTFVEKAEHVDYESQVAVFILIELLIKKKENLDLVIDWKPFAKILEDNYFSKGVRYILKLHSQKLVSAIYKIKRYFPKGTTEEVLSIYRPKLCVQDLILFKAQGFICLFIPHNHRETFWIPEIMNVWKWIGLYPTWDSQFLRLIANAVPMTLGSFDWDPYLDFILQKLVVSFELPIGTSSDLYNEYPMDECNIFSPFDFAKSSISHYGAIFIVWTLNSKKDFQSFNYLKKLIKSIESFCHPSNEGDWTEHLGSFLLELCSQFATRCQREFELRKSPVLSVPLSSVKVVIPEECMLSEEFQKEFVELIYPLVLKGMYGKSQRMQACSQHCLKQLSYVRPEVVLPPLLNQCFHALQTLTEIHQTVAALDVLSFVVTPLLRSRDIPERDDYLLDILSMTLPGIDTNDSQKTQSTMKFITSLLYCIPLFTEGSERGPVVINYFEEWCLKLLDRIFSLLQNDGGFSDEVSSRSLRGICSFFFQQLSPSLYERCLRSVYNFVSTEFLLQSKKNIGILCSAVVIPNKKFALQLFIPLCYNRLVVAKTGEVQQVSDNEKIWYIFILSKVIRNAGEEVLPYQQEIWKIVELFIDTEEKEIASSVNSLIKSYLYTLTSYYLNESRSLNPSTWDKLDKIDHWEQWGHFTKMKDVDINWHIPSRVEIVQAVRFVNKFLVYICNKLKDYNLKIQNDEPSISRNLVHTYFSLIEGFMAYGLNFIPEIKGENIPRSTFSFPDIVLACSKIEYIPEGNEPPLAITLEEITDICCDTANILFTKQKDVSHLLPAVISCLTPIFTSRFIESQNLVNSDVFNLVKNQNFKVFHKDHAKLPRYFALTKIVIELNFRNLCYTISLPYSKHHEKVIELLISHSLSSYHEHRKSVHTILFSLFQNFTLDVVGKYIERIIEIPSRPDITDDEVVGALSLLGNKLCVDHILSSWKHLAQFMVSLSKTKHIEKVTTLAKLNEIFDIYFNSMFQLQIKTEEDKAIYASLISELVQIAQDSNLHWKFQTMIASFLLILIRSDGVIFPLEGVSLLFTMLASYTPRVRVIASEAVNLILSQFIPVQPKKTVKISEKNFLGKWNSLPIPTSNEEFMETSFFEKNYFGWIEAPTEAQVYDYSKPCGGGEAEKREELKQIFRKIMTDSWLERFFRYNTERDGDPFSETMTQLYKGLFQILGTEFYDIGMPYILKIAKEAGSGKSDEGGHIAAISEFTSGLLRGMKHWPFHLQQQYQKELTKLWDDILDKCSQGTIQELTDGLEFAFADRDPRRNQLIISYFFNRFKDNLNSTSSSTLSRNILLLYSIVGEVSWRDTNLMVNILKELSNHLTNPYQQARENISLLIALIMKTIWVPKQNEKGLPAIRLPTSYYELDIQDCVTRDGGDDTEQYFPYIHEFVTKYISMLEEDPSTGKLRLYSSLPVSTDEHAQKEEERRCLKSFADTILGFISGLYSTCAPHALVKYTIDFVKVCAVLQDQNDENVHSEANVVLLTIADFPFSPMDAKNIITFIISQFNTFTNWRVRKSFLSFLNIFIFRHQFPLLQSRDELFSLLLSALKDQQVEVRQAASVTLASYLKISDDNVVNKFAEECMSLVRDQSETRQKRKKRKGSITKPTAFKRLDDTILLHAGILGLRAVVIAYPHEIPPFLPPILVFLAKFIHDRVQHIREAIRITFSDFWKCHRDSWMIEKKYFDEDQLLVLTDILVSPSYYA